MRDDYVLQFWVTLREILVKFVSADCLFRYQAKYCGKYRQGVITLTTDKLDDSVTGLRKEERERKQKRNQIL